MMIMMIQKIIYNKSETISDTSVEKYFLKNWAKKKKKTLRINFFIQNCNYFENEKKNSKKEAKSPMPKQKSNEAVNGHSPV